MGQVTFATTDEFYGQLKQLQAELDREGKIFSLSRTLGYLIGFYRAIKEEAAAVNAIDGSAKRSDAWRDLVMKAMDFYPSKKPRGSWRLCHKATPEKRAYVTQQIIQRLGVLHPPKELVDYYLDRGGMDPMAGSRVVTTSAEEVERREREAAERLDQDELKALEEKVKEELQKGDAVASSEISQVQQDPTEPVHREKL